MHGPIFTDGTTSAANMFWAHLHGNSANQTTEVHVGTPAAAGSALGSSRNYLPPWIFLYQRLTWVSANTFKHEVSHDGISWISTNGNQSKTMTPTHYGFAWSGWDSAAARAVSFEYFRVDA